MTQVLDQTSAERAPAGGVAARDARFITPSFRSPGDVGGPAPYLRTDFTAGEGLRRATLSVTALGLIDCYLNGRRVGDDVLTPGWTAYEHRLVVSDYDVTDLVRMGDNALGAIVGDGWAVGQLTWDEKTRCLWADRPAAFVSLELDYGDRIERVTTDLGWRSSEGAIRENGIYAGETYDARLEPDGWAEPGFDASGWSGVEVVDVDPATLIAPMAPPIRRTEELPAVAVLTTPSGRTVVDFGQILTGWVRLRVRGAAGTTVTLRHCELLVDGEPCYTSNRGAAATDRYTLRGAGNGDDEEAWEPRFTFHGFRYVDVEGWPGELDPGALTGIVVHSDMTRTGWFETSNELVNQLHRNVVWSMRGNFVGVPTDCPQRDERLGWTGDINAFGPTAAFLYDVRGVLGSWLQDLAAEQAAKGFVPNVVPNAMRTSNTPTALWGDVAVSLPWTLYREYGDAELLRRQYPSMKAFVESVERMLDEKSLWSKGFQWGDWLDPDAPPDNPAAAKTDPYLLATAYFCKVTSELAKTAGVLGQTEDAQRFSELHERVRNAFRQEWVAPSGLVVNDSATAYSLAICFGLLDPAQEQRAGERLAEVVAKAGYRISTGFAGTPLVTHALSRTGQLDTAYRLLLEKRCPSFLYPVTMGATTIWERWDAVQPDGTFHDTGMTSLNHYALGAVAEWLHSVVGGLTAAEPGYRSIRIAPLPGGGLTYATVTHDTPYGRAKVAWRREGSRMILDLVVPEGVTADVVLPEHPDRLTERVGAGEFRWEYEVAARARRTYTLDSLLSEVAADPDVWPAVSAVFLKHFPEQGSTGGGNGGAGAFGNASLRDVLSFLPNVAEQLEAELTQVLSG